jgi:hypothetical protein
MFLSKSSNPDPGAIIPDPDPQHCWSPCFSLDLHSGVGHFLLLILCFLHVVERAALEEPVVEAGRPGRQGPRNGGEGGGTKQTHHAGRVCGIRHRSVVLLVYRSSKISQGYGNFSFLKYIFEEQINVERCSDEKYEQASR